MSCPFSPDPIPRCFEGRTAALLASGPSLTPKQVWQASQAGWVLAGVNNQCVYALDLLYAPDFAWINTVAPRTAHIPRRWSTLTDSQRSPRNPTPRLEGWCYVDTLPREPFSRGPTSIARGRHAGYQLINLMALTGATRLVLLGYDCRRVDGERHWFGPHPTTALERNHADTVYESWALLYRQLTEPTRELGVEVINATPDSAIDAFVRAPLDSLL